MRNPLFPRDYLRFFIPLAVQGIAQSLTHPLVAMVASHGPGGTLALAGQGQAGNLLFILQTVNLGLLTTGMVYGRSRGGYRAFVRAWAIVGTFTLCAQIVTALPPVAHWVFAGVLGLPPSIEGPARVTLAAGIVARLLFHLRTPFVVLLLNNRASARASAAAVGRVALALVLAPLFVHVGLVGNFWGEVCLSLSALLELAAVAVMARPFKGRYTPDEGRAPTAASLIAFTIPLSLGSTILSISGSVLSAFVARAPDPEIVLPVYQLTLSVTGTIGYAATQLERIVLAFAPGCLRDRSTVRFAVAVGAAVGLAPLLFQLEPLRSAYFVHVQNLPREHLGMLALMTVMLTGQALLTALRSRLQGIASYYKAPVIVVAGSATLLVAMAATGAIGLATGVPGLFLPPLGLYVANGAAIVCMEVMVRLRERAGNGGRAADLDSDRRP